MTEQKQQDIETTYSNDESIRPDDVLLGRGGATNNHLGNRKFRSIVLQHRPQYLIARKTEKILIAREVVATVHSNGGRFLRQCDASTWVEVSPKRAQEKASQALREGLDVRHGQVRQKEVNQSGKKVDRKPYTIKQTLVTGKVATTSAPKINEKSFANHYIDKVTAEIISSLIRSVEAKKEIGI